MSTNSGIQWTTHTFNPWWGCIKVAQGCKFCYAEGVATRFYGRKVWGPNSERKIASEKVWNDPARWNRAAERAGERAKVFCLSMGDVLEDHPALIEPRKRLVGIIESTPWLDWQLLTKRPENAAMFGWGDTWPANVWFGASAANQDECEGAIDALGNVGAAVRFLSLEPLIGPINLDLEKTEWSAADYRRAAIDPEDVRPYRQVPLHIGWIIVGGESGTNARPCDVAWIRSIVQQCKAAAVPCFVKQLGSTVHCRNDYVSAWLDEVGMGLDYIDTSETRMQGDPVRVMLNDRKGGNPDEWPEDLRVREFPKRLPAC